MSVILVIIPTLGRAAKLRPLAENIRDTTRSGTMVMFVTERDDLESQEMFPAGDTLAVTVYNRRKRNWAGALNSGYRSAVHYGLRFTHVFAGADDLLFTPGWDVHALGVLAADPALRVVGTNDLHSPAVLAGEGATAYLIDRRYIDETGGVADQPPGIVQCEAYGHGFTDSEFTRTARARGVWAPCLDSVVEHCHPNWGRGEWDDGYRKTQDPQLGISDMRILASRRCLWEDLMVP